MLTPVQVLPLVSVDESFEKLTPGAEACLSQVAAAYTGGGMSLVDACVINLIDIHI